MPNTPHERSETDMSPAELQELQTHMQRLESSITTEEEREQSRRRIDEIRWRGPMGAVSRVIDQFEARLKAVEASTEVGGLSEEFQALPNFVAELRVGLEALKTEFEGLFDKVVTEVTGDLELRVKDAALIAVAELMDTPTEPPPKKKD